MSSEGNNLVDNAENAVPKDWTMDQGNTLCTRRNKYTDTPDSQQKKRASRSNSRITSRSNSCATVADSNPGPDDDDGGYVQNSPKKKNQVKKIRANQAPIVGASVPTKAKVMKQSIGGSSASLLSTPLNTQDGTPLTTQSGLKRSQPRYTHPSDDELEDEVPAKKKKLSLFEKYLPILKDQTNHGNIALLPAAKADDLEELECEPGLDLHNTTTASVAALLLNTVARIETKVDNVGKAFLELIADLSNGKSEKKRDPATKDHASRTVNQMAKQWNAAFSRKYVITVAGVTAHPDKFSRMEVLAQLQKLHQEAWPEPTFCGLSFGDEIRTLFHGYVGRIDEMARMGKALAVWMWEWSDLSTLYMLPFVKVGSKKEQTMPAKKVKMPSKMQDFFAECACYLGGLLIEQTQKGTQTDYMWEWLNAVRYYVVDLVRRTLSTMKKLRSKGANAKELAKHIPAAEEYIKVPSGFIPVFSRQHVKEKLKKAGTKSKNNVDGKGKGTPKSASQPSTPSGVLQLTVDPGAGISATQPSTSNNKEN